MQEKQKGQRRKPERLTNLRVKWDGNEKKGEIGGGRGKAVRKESLRGNGGWGLASRTTK